MYVKMLFGPKNGEIVDLRNDVALEFLRTKKAARAFDDPAPTAPVIVASVVPDRHADHRPARRKASR